MPPSGQSKPRINYPLWIIAISLLVIAVCLVVDSIERQKRARTNDDPVAAVASPDPAPAVDDSVVRTEAKPKREPSTTPPTAENSVPASPPVVDAASSVAVMAAESSDVGGPQPVGYSVSGISAEKGEIVGRITLNGTLPAETILSANPSCPGSSGPIMTRTFVVGESNGLADAVVFLKVGVNPATILPTTTTATVLLTNCEVQPYITAVMVRQPISFRDGEDTQHDVFVKDNSVHGTLSVSPNSERQLRFTQPRLFTWVQCLRHTSEAGYVCVLENPFFAVTDNNGNFDIPNIPPGTYTVEVAHRGATGTNGVTRSVIVVAGKTAELNVTLKVPKGLRP